jgi:hypothetical protein
MACVRSARWSGSLIATAVLLAAPILAAAQGGSPAPFPLSWDDPVFANAVDSGSLTLSGGATASDLSIALPPEDPYAATCCGTYTLERVRIRAREGVRVASGSVTLRWVWSEAEGQPGDHSDPLQCYGDGGNTFVHNTTFRAYNHDSSAGYYASGGFLGFHHLENVLFWGGPYGIRINSDGGYGIALKDVYFVEGSFDYGPFSIRIPVTQWENVRWARIENGALVVGDPIPVPIPDCGDGLDNDRDGLVDLADPACGAESWPVESSDCQDGLDNDGDGGIDFDGGASRSGGDALAAADVNCNTGHRSSELPRGEPCGLGAELLIGLAALQRLQRRRRVSAHG